MGQEPEGVLAIGGNGALYGVTQYGGAVGTGASGCLYGDGEGCGIVFELAPPAVASGSWTETQIYAFTGQNGDGAFPVAGLLIGTDGVLFGVTELGGNPACTDGCGTVFKLTPPASAGDPWTETILHSFSGGHDGAVPAGMLVFGRNGALYGTTFNGGNTTGGRHGTVFGLAR